MTITTFGGNFKSSPDKQISHAHKAGLHRQVRQVSRDRLPNMETLHTSH